jgi:predicted Zn-dependent peptidase
MHATEKNEMLVDRAGRTAILTSGACAVVLLAAACGGEPPSATPARPSVRPFQALPAPPLAPPDPLGARPAVAPPAAWTPPVPVTYERKGGTKVWLLERHALPLVSVQIVVPAGAAADPVDKAGLALATANMLDEGAGKRGALELARAVDDLGASLSTGAVQDYAFVQLTTLTKNLAPALGLWGDVVARPTFSAVEWKRVHDLWMNDLKARQSDAEAVAAVVLQKVAFPSGHPYAHPAEGTLASAAKVSLDDVKRFYAAQWRPDRATVVVVGDVTKEQLEPLLDKALAGWTAPKGKAPEPPAWAEGGLGIRTRRVVVVDRPDAPQSVIAMVAPGVAAGDTDAAGLVRVNGALGGSFTSRLNQDLREEHGWSYGARSRFSFSRMRGLFAAQAAVQTDHTGDALKAMIADVGAMAEAGLRREEVDKTRLLARADLVEAYEGVAGAARRVSRMAGVGLPPDHDAKASARIFALGGDELAKLARSYMDPAGADIVIVGPRTKIAPQLEAIGLKDLEARGPEGDVSP